jgi:hypothetical protein
MLALRCLAGVSQTANEEDSMLGSKKLLIVLAAVVSVVATSVAAGSPATHASAKKAAAPVITRKLTPSSATLASCMPRAELNVVVALTTDEIGFDSFTITARRLPANRSFTVFLLEQAASPFGAAEYIGDFTTDANGNAQNTFHLIVQEAFSSTLVNGNRVRADLNQIGSWFADPKDDDFCLGQGSPVTPFDGDNEAGVQAFNSANAAPLPAP